MGVLNVEHRIVARLLGDLDEIEVERRVVLPEKHHEANRPLAHFIHDLPERNERARSLRHLDRLAAAKQADELTELNVEIGLAAGQCCKRRLHALHMAAMVSAPHVDTGGETETA